MLGADESLQEKETQEETEITVDQNNDGDSNIYSRPKRVRQAPERFKDYVCSFIGTLR